MEKEEDIKYREVVKEVERLRLKSKLKKLDKASLSKKNRIKYMGAVASIILLISTIVLFYVVNSPSSKKIYANYFTPYPNVIEPAVRSMDSLTERKTVFLHYEKGNYSKAIEGFNNLLKDDDNSEIRFYLAMSLLNQEKEKEALIILEQLSKKEFRFAPQINWYKALIYIKKESFFKAEKALNELLKSDSEYKKEEALDLKEILE